MCGIAGFFDYLGGRPQPERVLVSMLDRIEHRGPDDAGAWYDGSLAMGMRRLSIIDVDGGQQPFRSEDGRYQLVGNGEIYNHGELRRSLQARGHRFQSGSDIEVIVHLYEEYGSACVDHLNGMFAFAVWDAVERELFIARDRVGIKPLYYADVGGELVFGSELKSVLCHPDVDADLSPTGLSDYLTYRYVPAPRTMFDGIVSLPPGHTLTCSRRGVSIDRYWDVSYQPAGDGHPTERAYGEELDRRLMESVRMQMMSDVPYGAFLSGGIDSSLIVAMMTRHTERPVTTFSAGFRGDGTDAYSELPYARLVADELGTDHHEVLVGAQDYRDLLPELAWHLDQPIADYVQPIYHALARYAAGHVKMVLTGEGGDELFGGYVRYTGNQAARYTDRVPPRLRSEAYRLADRYVSARRPKAALYALARDSEAARLASWMPLFNFEQKAAVLSDGLADRLGDYDPISVVEGHLAATDAVDDLNRFLYVDMKMWLPDYLLSRGDKVTMAASLEARVPMLDHTLVEFAAGLPVSMKARGNERKRLLKQVARRRLPAAVIDRKKVGFSVPFPVWLRTELRDFAHDLLSTETVTRRGLFDPVRVRTLLDEHDRGEADHASMIYGLINLELWQQAFTDVAVSARAA